MSYRTLARNHDFTVLWIGATISEFGTRVTAFAMPLVAYAMTGSAAWAAAAEACYLLGLVGMLLPAGVLADRCDRGRLMQLSMAGGCLCHASLAVAGVAGALALPHLLTVAALGGVAAGLFGPLETSAIRTVVPTDELPTALSQQQGRQHVAALVGGPAGGAMFGIARWAPFLADTISYGVGWLLVRRIRTDLSPAPDVGTARPWRDLTEGLRFTWARPFLRVLLMWTPLANLTINALFFLALLRLIEAGFPAWQIGLVESVLGGCGILGALAAPWLIERIPTGRLTIAAAWSVVPLSLPLAFWNHPAVMAAAGALALFLLPAGNAGVGSYRVAVTPAHLVGRVQSAMQFVAMLAMPLAPVVGGALLAGLGGRDAVLTLAALIAAVSLVPTLSRSVRAIPRPAVWRTTIAAEPAGVTPTAGAR